MKVAGLIVTYGDRFHLINEVINELLNQQIHVIYIIDNNSSTASKEKLDKLKNNNKKKIQIYRLNTNTGTAYAFKYGLEKIFHDSNSDFIWILDDDNLPCRNALEELKSFWDKCKYHDKEKRLILLSYRENKKIYKYAVEKNNPQVIIGRHNIFRSFHLFALGETIQKKMFPINDKNGINNIKYGEVTAAPYGGSFFNKKVLELIGYPDENYYIYGDDYDFSYRIIKQNGKIILVLDSVIKDIEQSWNIQGVAVYNIVKQRNQVALYYSIRNRIYLEKKELVTNYFMYSINMIIYSSVVLFLGLILFRFKNIKTYFIALYNGLKGEFGKNKNYVLK